MAGRLVDGSKKTIKTVSRMDEHKTICRSSKRKRSVEEEKDNQHPFPSKRRRQCSILETSNVQSRFLQLPLDLLHVVLEFCSQTDIFSLQETCRMMHSYRLFANSARWYLPSCKPDQVVSLLDQRDRQKPLDQIHVLGNETWSDMDLNELLTKTRVTSLTFDLFYGRYRAHPRAESVSKRSCRKRVKKGSADRIRNPSCTSLSFHCASVSEETLIDLSKGLCSLQYLDLLGCADMGTRMCATIGTRWPDLRSLTLGVDVRYMDSRLAPIREQELIILFKQCTRLEYLHLCHAQVQSNILKCIQHAPKSLEHLRLSWMKGMLPLDGNECKQPVKDGTIHSLETLELVDMDMDEEWLSELLNQCSIQTLRVDGRSGIESSRPLDEEEFDWLENYKGSGVESIVWNGGMMFSSSTDMKQFFHALHPMHLSIGYPIESMESLLGSPEKVFSWASSLSIQTTCNDTHMINHWLDLQHVLGPVLKRIDLTILPVSKSQYTRRMLFPFFAYIFPQLEHISIHTNSPSAITRRDVSYMESICPKLKEFRVNGHLLCTNGQKT